MQVTGSKGECSPSDMLRVTPEVDELTIEL